MAEKRRKFVLKKGLHGEPDPKTGRDKIYDASERPVVVESDRNLIEMFPGKFSRYVKPEERLKGEEASDESEEVEEKDETDVKAKEEEDSEQGNDGGLSDLPELPEGFSDYTDKIDGAAADGFRVVRKDSTKKYQVYEVEDTGLLNPLSEEEFNNLAAVDSFIVGMKE